MRNGTSLTESNYKHQSNSIDNNKRKIMNSNIVAFPIATLRFISLSHLPSFSTSDPRNVKLDTNSISSPSISKLFQLAVVIIFFFFMLKYRPPFHFLSLAFLSVLPDLLFSCWHQCCVICISQIVQCPSCYFHSFLCLFHFCFSHYPLRVQVE